MKIFARGRMLLFLITFFVIVSTINTTIYASEVGNDNNIQVTKQALQNTVGPNTTIEFTISVENVAATGDIQVTQVTDELPVGFNYETGSGDIVGFDGFPNSLSGVVSVTGQTVMWDLTADTVISEAANLNAGLSGGDGGNFVISYSALVPDTSGQFTNSACVGHETAAVPVCASTDFTVQVFPDTGLMNFKSILILGGVFALATLAILYYHNLRISSDLEKRLLKGS